VSEPAAAGRDHGLDALRAFALLLGVLLHSVLPFVVAPGHWAVGTKEPSKVLALTVYYVHSFRLEIFFLLAGFFGAMVVARRGAGSYLRDRARRILLVFAIGLYPMKAVLGALWIAGGLETGWLDLPPDVRSLSLVELGIGALFLESWPNITLTHLWFLYYLACTVALFMALRAVVAPIGRRVTALDAIDRVFFRLVSARLAPLALAIVVTPILVMMTGMDIDTPDSTFVWHLPVMLLYGLFFAFGWWLHWHAALFAGFARRWRSSIAIGIIVAIVVAIGIGMRAKGAPWAVAHPLALKWLTSFGTSVTMMFSVFGWMGCFHRVFANASPAVRYVADASYWVYIVHLPVVVALQLVLAPGNPWWIAVPCVNVAAMATLLASYHVFVRYTWIGAWLNGRRAVKAAAPAPEQRAGLS
jgi:peptidoglycan/LPS O-acetylase OafA/YrhL